MIVCTYEDREEALVGLKLLALSLAHHCPDVELHACVPGASPAFREWAARQPALRLLPEDPSWPTGWDVKPTLLADRLDAGYGEVTWLDADILVTRDFRHAWPGDESVVVAAENREGPQDSSTVRTQAFGLQVGRVFQAALNSSVVRVTARHRHLIARWSELLDLPEYKREQTRPANERALHLTGDQDALAALLGSTECVETPVRVLSPPGDILHVSPGVYRDYPIAHRLTHVTSGWPPFVHALGLPKPWSRAFQVRRSVGLSPYCAAAVPYEPDLGEPAPWLRPRGLWGWASRVAALGSPCFRDLPTTMAAELARRLGRR